MDAEQAADDIDLGEFGGSGDPERVAVNVETAYREFDPSRPAARPTGAVRPGWGWSSRH
jgi:hypothetical protein